MPVWNGGDERGIYPINTSDKGLGPVLQFNKEEKRVYKIEVGGILYIPINLDGLSAQQPAY